MNEIIVISDHSLLISENFSQITKIDSHLNNERHFNKLSNQCIKRVKPANLVMKLLENDF